MNGTYITAQQAKRILDGFQSGDLDYLDVECIFDDPEAWLAASDSMTAREVRGEVYL